MAVTKNCLAIMAAWLVAVQAQDDPSTFTPDQSTLNVVTAKTGPPPSVKPTSYSYTFTVTTPTSIWNTPTFVAATPLPSCSGNMCTGQTTLDKQKCVDADGQAYGVLCDAHFYGIAITNSGKKFLRGREEDSEALSEDPEEALSDAVIDARDYEGNFANCADFCNNYQNPSDCTGLDYHSGYCNSYDTITGTYKLVGGIAAIRQR